MEILKGIPNSDIKNLIFKKNIAKNELYEFYGHPDFLLEDGFDEINWLNTPGPFYTTYTDNCGTGQIEALKNVGGDEDYHEVIFRQPIDKTELKEVLSAAIVDPYGEYYFDGNKHWNSKNIILWWGNSEKRITEILKNYREELMLPSNIDELRPLYGPRNPIPQNYLDWLDFYRFEMKNYLEWYIEFLEEIKIELPILNFDWSKKEEIEKKFKSG